MTSTTLCSTETITAVDYRCSAGPADKPYAETHMDYSIAFVRRGSFGYRHRGRHFDMVPGSVLIGNRQDEFMCTHDHQEGGDCCLCFKLSPAMRETIGDGNGIWQRGAVAPQASLMVLGELAQAAAAGDSDVALEEVGLALASRVARLAGGDKHGLAKIRARDRQRVVEAAHWLDHHAHEEIDLAQAGRAAGLSAFHFLRLFAKVVGVTPHQYLIQARLRRAAKLLAKADLPITEIAFEVGFGDLSNFVRSFHRAAGMSPRDFRRVARGGRRAA